jgi:CRP/FNR family transcriptional regulator, cyclic AMP receptor protein
MLPGPIGRGCRTLERVMATHTDEKLELLKRTPLLAGLSRGDLEEVGRLADEVDLKAGHVLMREGDLGREFFVIIEGEVQVERGGRQVATVGPGKFVGDIALVTERPRTATVTTITPCRLLVVGHREFHQLMDQFPTIRMSVLESMAILLRDLEPNVPH